MSRCGKSAGRWWLLAAVTCSLAGTSGLAEEPELIRFRHVYVDAARPESWPVGGQRYLPLSADEFERLVSRARDAGNAASGRVPRCTDLTLDCKLTEAGFLAGELVMSISDPAESTGVLPVTSHSLAISNPRWQVDGVDAEPATWGVYQPAGSKAWQQAITVLGSGQVAADFTIRGRPLAGGGLRFDIRLPDALAATMVIEAENSLRPVIDSGLILEAQVGVTTSRYRVAIDGSGELALRLEPPFGRPTSEISTRVFQQSRFEISEHGLRFNSTLHIQPDSKPLDVVQLRLDSTLQVTDVKSNGTAVPWTVREDAESEGTILAVDFGGLDVDHTSRLEVFGLAPVELGQPWSLPRLRPINLFWMSGSSELLIAAPLELRNLQTEACRPLSPLQSAEPAAGTYCQIAEFSAAATVWLDIIRFPNVAAVDQLTSVTLSPDGTSAEVLLQLEAQRGSLGIVEFELEPGWRVDSVTSVPQGRVGDWSLVTMEADRSRIRVVLNRPLETSQAVVLRVAARRPPHEFGSVYSTEQLQVVRLDPVRQRQVVVRVRALRPWECYRLPGHTDESGVAESRLAEFSAEVPAIAWDVFFEGNERSPHAQIAVKRQRTPLAVEIDLACTVGKSSLQTAATYKCTPRRGFVDELEISFVADPGTPLRWRLNGRASSDLEIFPVERDPLNDVFRTWRIGFRQPLSEPFEVQVTFRRLLANRLQLPLTSVKGAAVQQGRLEVHTTRPREFFVTGKGITPVPPPRGVQGGSGTPLGAFEYRGERLGSDDRPQVELVAVPLSTDVEAWIWQMEIDSTYSPVEGGRHRVRLDIENHGEEGLELILAAGAVLESVAVDERRVTAAVVDGGKARRIPLDAGQRRAVVTCVVSQPAARLSAGGRLSQPKIQSNLATFMRSWQIRVPGGYALFPQSDQDSHATWQSRLAGPLVGDRGSSMLQLRGNVTTAVTYLESSSMWTTATLVVMIAALLAIAIHRRSGRSVAAMLTISIVLTLILPHPWWCVAWYAAAGFVAGPICYAATNTRLATRGAFATRAAGTLTGCFLVFWLFAPSSALGDSPTVHQVLIPVEEPGQPEVDTPPQMGETVHVSEVFYAALLARNRAAELPLGEVLVLDAQYSCHWLEPGSDEPPADLTWAAEFAIEACVRDARLRLPWTNRAIESSSVEVHVDGAVTRVAPSRNALEVPFAEPGQHRVSIRFQPRWKVSGSLRRIELPVPPTPSAKCTLHGVVENAEVEFRNSFGVFQPIPPGQLVQVALGPVASLVLQGPRESGSEDAGQELAVTPDLQLNIELDSVSIAMRLHVTPGRNRVRRIQLELDPTLEFLPVGDAYRVDTVTIAEDGMQRVELILQSPQANEFTVDAICSVVDRKGVGIFLPPRIRVVNADTQTGTCAVYIAPELHHVVSQAEPESRLELDPFGSPDWQSGPPPTLAFAHAPQQNQWQIATRIPRPVVTASQSSEYQFSKNSISVRYQASVEVEQQSVFAHHLSLPRHVVVNHVAIRDAAGDIPVRWATDSDGELTLFPLEPRIGKYKILVDAVCPHITPGELTLEVFEIEADDYRDSIIELRRGTGVSLELLATEGVELENGTPGSFEQSRSTREVALLRYDIGNPVSVKVRWDSLVPQVNTTIQTILVPTAGAWLVRVAGEVAVEQGTLDELAFEVSEPLTGDIAPQIDGGTLRVNQMSADGSRRIDFYPELPIRDTQKFAFAGTSGDAAGPVMPLPRVAWRGPGQVRRYVALPRTAFGQSIRWESRGLVPVADQLQSGDPQNGHELDWYIVTREDYQAVPVANGAPGDQARILSADMTMFPQADGGTRAICSYFVAPYQSRSCVVDLPEEMSLIAAWVGVTPASLHRVSARQYRVEFPSTELTLPVTIAVASPGTSDPRVVRSFHFPKLLSDEEGEELLTEQFSWSIRAGDGRVGRRLTGNRVGRPLLLRAVAGGTQSVFRIGPSAHESVEADSQRLV